jgi:hypothetical protein
VKGRSTGIKKKHVVDGIKKCKEDANLFRKIAKYYCEIIRKTQDGISLGAAGTVLT